MKHKRPSVEIGVAAALVSADLCHIRTGCCCCCLRIYFGWMKRKRYKIAAAVMLMRNGTESLAKWSRRLMSEMAVQSMDEWCQQDEDGRVSCD